MGVKDRKKIISGSITILLVIAGVLSIFWFLCIIREPAAPVSSPKQVFEINSATYDKIVNRDTQKISLPLDSADFGRTNPFDKY